MCRPDCHVPENARRCCLSFCLTKDEMVLIRSADPFFDVLNVDKDCSSQYCPCLFTERLTKSEVAVLRAVTQKPMWGETASAIGSALTAALPALFGGPLPKREGDDG